MYGISGVVWIPSRISVDQSAWDRVAASFAHRGLDDRGTLLLPGVALERRPTSNEEEMLWIAFDGEIHNKDALRRELIARGHRFKSDAATEVLLRLYEEEDGEMLHRLNGTFVLAIYDITKRKLFLARDRLGRKPLYYRIENKRLLFGSDLKSVLLHELVSREIDPIALDEYLTYQYVPHPRTIFKEISKLPPGHYATWCNGNFSVTKYWNPDLNGETDRPYDELREELRALLIDAVDIRLPAAEPPGAFLSGGVDSSIITGLTQKLCSSKVRTFSIGFPQQEYDETTYARQVAERFGTDHTELIVAPDIHGIIETIIEHCDEPFADSSLIPTLALCELARKSVAVALSGDGGDELFAGYERYRAVQLGLWADGVPNCVRKLLAGPMRSLIPASTRQRSTLRRLKRFLEALGMEPMERYLQWIAIFNRQRRRELYTDEFAEQISGHDSSHFLNDAMTSCSRRDFVTQISLVDLQTYLPCDCLTKVDIAATTHSLKVRSPLLDHRVVEFATKIPLKHKIHGRVGKHIFRDAFRDFLSPDIDKRQKMGFGVPIDVWFRGPLREFVREILLDSQTLNRRYFRREYVERLLNDHFENRFDHAYRIWSLVVLELWLRRWTG